MFIELMRFCDHDEFKMTPPQINKQNTFPVNYLRALSHFIHHSISRTQCRTWNILVTMNHQILWLAASCSSVLSFYIIFTKRSSLVIPSKRLITLWKYIVHCLYVYHLLFLSTFKVPCLSCSSIYTNIDPISSTRHGRCLINTCRLNGKKKGCLLNKLQELINREVIICVLQNISQKVYCIILSVLTN